MKHSVRITLILLALFFVTQVFGLLTINENIVVTKTVEGVVEIQHQDTIVGEAPQTSSGYQSIFIIAFAIIVGTLLLLLLIKLGIRKIFKYWYFFAVVVTIAITVSVYFENYVIALLAGVTLAWFKVHKHNVIIHNLSEVLVYTGIAVLLVSLFDGYLWSAFVLLILISLYDIYAVWKSKHMVTLVKYQTESNLFAGLSIPYSLKAAKKAKLTTKKPKKGATKVAVLGGGDIAFPLLFAGAVMSDLILTHNFDKLQALGMTSIIAITATLSLAYLLIKGKQNKFYPAMPFLSAGCFLGYGIIFLFL